VVLRGALDGLNPAQEKSRPRLLAALGVTHVHQGNVDEASRLGREALATSLGTAVQPNLQDVVNLRRLLEPWRDSAHVRDLDELIAAAQRRI
jgi:hypothetical protein